MSGPRIPAGWRQFLLLSLAFAALGGGAALLLYRTGLESVQDSARHWLLATAQTAARSVDPTVHAALVKPGDEKTKGYQELSSDLSKIVGTVGDLRRLSTVRRTDAGLVTVLSASRTSKSTSLQSAFLAPAPSLPKEAARAWRDGSVAITSGPIEYAGRQVQQAFVPIFAPDRSVDALLVVESDYAPVAERIADLSRTFWICLFGVASASALFSWALSLPTGRSAGAAKDALDLRPDRRIWVMLGLLVASVTIVSDGALGYFNISASNETARQASTALRYTTAVQEVVGSESSPGWTKRLDEAGEYFDQEGDTWLAKQIERYKLAAAGPGQNLRAAKTSLLAAIRLTDARARGELWAAGNDIQSENSQQGVRLVTTVTLGIVALVLMAALSLKERRLDRAIDGHTAARQQYDAVLGTLPIGLFSYREGRVLFTNGAWAQRHGPRTEDVFSAVHPGDREALAAALQTAEEGRSGFSLVIRAATGADYRHYEASGTPVLDEKGALKHVLVFCADVTPIAQARDEVQRKARELDEKNHQLSAALRHIEHSLHTIVRTMVRAVEVKDPYTGGHSERVRQYSVWMGEHVGLSRYEMRILSYGALIHDVGKIGIPDEILTKPGALTREEFEEVKLHTVYGASIVQDIEMFKDCVPIVRWHHERLDGSGYPDGLVGDQIPFLARLVAVADMFDAMTSVRSYRISLSPESALETMAGEVSQGKLDGVAFAALEAVVEGHGVIPQVESGPSSRAA